MVGRSQVEAVCCLELCQCLTEHAIGGELGCAVKNVHDLRRNISLPKSPDALVFEYAHHRLSKPIVGTQTLVQELKPNLYCIQRRGNRSELVRVVKISGLQVDTYLATAPDTDPATNVWYTSAVAPFLRWSSRGVAIHEETAGAHCDAAVCAPVHQTISIKSSSIVPIKSSPSNLAQI